MAHEYLPRKHGLRDLREALALHAKVELLTGAEETEFQTLLARLDRLNGMQFVEVIASALDSGLALRPERREPIPTNETPETERKRREREQTF